jgi:SpoIIAA-like
LIAHLKFVRDHHTLIDRIAVVADGLVARLVPSIASHFVNATLEHFDDEATALAWLDATLAHGDPSPDKAPVS